MAYQWQDTFEKTANCDCRVCRGPLQKPVHVLVTVEVLGEGINIPNADTCMFVEPRNSYRSIIQAIGRCAALPPCQDSGAHRPASCGDPELKICVHTTDWFQESQRSKVRMQGIMRGRPRLFTIPNPQMHSPNSLRKNVTVSCQPRNYAG